MSTTDPTHEIDLAAERLGGRALLASDEFFAPKENLLRPGRGVFKPDLYTDHGKWMDGWESRRRRDQGYDWCIVRLAVPALVHGVLVDTHHFRGNHPAACSIDGCSLPFDCGLDTLQGPGAWQELLGRVGLQGHHEHLFEITPPSHCTHLRLNIYPDGGVARFRVFGDPRPDWPALLHGGGPVDLVAALHGGRIAGCSDMFFSAPPNLLMPYPPENMGDGWETRRRRGPGHDWCVIELGRRGTIETLEIGTLNFKGNYPARASVERADLAAAPAGAEPNFVPLLPETPLEADRIHRFDVDSNSPCTHLRLNIFPDGGVSRFRAYGRPCGGSDSDDR